MRLPILLTTGLAALHAVALAAPAYAQEPYHGPAMPPPPMQAPAVPPQGWVPPPQAPYGGQSYQWQQPGAPTPGPWTAPCDPSHGQACGGAYPAPYGYPGYTMVPIVIQGCCCQQHVTEEVVEEEVPAHRRYIPPRRHIPDKRVRLHPDKRVLTKRVPY